MKKNILLSNLLVFILLLHPVYASNQGADFLVDVGRASLIKGDVPDAIHEFSKALILEPNNVQALKELKKLGLEGGMYARTATRTTVTAEMAEHLKTYEKRISDLEKEKGQLQSVVDSLASPATINQDCFKKGRACSEAKALVTKECPLECVKKKVVKSIDQAIAYEKELSELTKRYWDLKRQMTADLDQQQKISHVMGEYVSIKDEKISQINDELIQKEIGLLRARKEVLEKSDDMSELQDSLMMYQESLDNKEQLLKKKDKELKDLISQMSSDLTTVSEDSVQCDGGLPTCGR